MQELQAELGQQQALVQQLEEDLLAAQQLAGTEDVSQDGNLHGGKGGSSNGSLAPGALDDGAIGTASSCCVEVLPWAR